MSREVIVAFVGVAASAETETGKGIEPMSSGAPCIIRSIGTPPDRMKRTIRTTARTRKAIGKGQRRDALLVAAARVTLDSVAVSK